MKFVSFRRFGAASETRAGVVLPIGIIDLAAAAPLVYDEADHYDWSLLGVLQNPDLGPDAAAAIAAAVVDELDADPDTLAWDDPSALQGSISFGGATILHARDDIRLLAPIPRPPSIRDFYAFEAHIANARANVGKSVPPAWYEQPVFYFANPGSVYGPNDDIPMPRTEQLDYELEIAAIISRPGRDIHAADAFAYIAGFTIMNDWSARDVQLQEMRVGLGPAKGKDFATSLGPAIVTLDELADTETQPGFFNLTMTAYVNGEERSRGSFADIYFPFAELIAHASRDATLYPGDVIGSGTVGTGCLLEVTAGQGPWLQRDDVVELKIDRLGTLRNRIV